jgi:serine/threonine protein kinase
MSRAKNTTAIDSESPLQSLTKEKRYFFLQKIGEGGLGTVSTYFDTFLNRIVAVKELKKENRKKSNCMQTFINEARLISYLDHPGVVAVYNTFFWDDRSLCYSMKMIEGSNLGVYLETFAPHTRLLHSLNPCLDIIKKICETLAFVHDRGVIHLDLKPENIMVGSYGEVLIMDWGTARLFNSKPYFDYLQRHADEPGLVKFEEEARDVILGTPMYMSPEQTCSTRDRLTPASDIFSVGILISEMLAGRHPFPAGDLAALMRQIREYEPPPLHEVNSDVPRRLSQICARMLAKKPENRYRSFHEILADITEFQNSGQAFSTRTCRQGEIIFREGDPGDYAFIVILGKVGVFKSVDNCDTLVAELGRDEIVGELAIFSGQPRTATIIALEPTVIRIMSRADVERELDKLSPWVGKMISGLSKRFINLNEKMVAGMIATPACFDTSPYRPLSLG